ncbi:MAG TPA: 2-oxo acid dehydrogenase subunit E2, partial [Actinomycetota bacterium]|nr:2-oxo acid dehydrogenase subunit E2 [Actinomycetota bacterium]
MPEPRTGESFGGFGPNAWLVEDMYEQYRRDPSSVSESWQEFFADYRRGDGAAQLAEAATGPAATKAAPTGPPPAPAEPAVAPAERPAPSAARPAPPQPQAPPPAAVVPPEERAEPQPTPIRGAGARIVSNMEASLGVPTATSVRQVPAKLLEVNRTILNNHLSRTSGGKVSFTHLIGFAVVRALESVPAM